MLLKELKKFYMIERIMTKYNDKLQIKNYIKHMEGYGCTYD